MFCHETTENLGVAIEPVACKQCLHQSADLLWQWANRALVVRICRKKIVRAGGKCLGLHCHVYVVVYIHRYSWPVSIYVTWLFVMKWHILALKKWFECRSNTFCLICINCHFTCQNQMIGNCLDTHTFPGLYLGHIENQLNMLSSLDLKTICFYVCLRILVPSIKIYFYNCHIWFLSKMKHRPSLLQYAWTNDG